MVFYVVTRPRWPACRTQTVVEETIVSFAFSGSGSSTFLRTERVQVPALLDRANNFVQISFKKKFDANHNLLNQSYCEQMLHVYL
jgi:hypothetical protein